MAAPTSHLAAPPSKTPSAAALLEEQLKAESKKSDEKFQQALLEAEADFRKARSEEDLRRAAAAEKQAFERELSSLIASGRELAGHSKRLSGTALVRVRAWLARAGLLAHGVPARLRRPRLVPQRNVQM